MGRRGVGAGRRTVGRRHHAADARAAPAGDRGSGRVRPGVARTPDGVGRLGRLAASRAPGARHPGRLGRSGRRRHGLRGHGRGENGELPAAARRPAVERAPPRFRHARPHPLPHERARPRPDGSPRCVARRAVPTHLLPLHERDTGDRVRGGPARHREAVREPHSIPGRSAARSSRHLRDELLDAGIHARQATGRTVLRRGARGRRPR